jgi:phosphopantothenoylcysteine decarboxylase/phosphopantothenate--cysteine ligase
MLLHRAMTDANGEQRRVALCVTGGIAAYKAVEILRGLQKAGCDVRVAMTKRAGEFVAPLTFRALSGHHVLVDDYAPDNPDPIAHITFSQTVDLMLVAPATANILGKFANGVADDFISSTYLAAHAPVLLAPAMNTTMWEHPATRRNVAQLQTDGARFVMPDAGEMACKTIGPGRLAEPDAIVRAALELLQPHSQDLAGERILITAGGTREAIDPVRFIANRSSGRMGFALAEAARARGAEVTLVAGATNLAPPAGVRFVSAPSAAEMFAAVQAEIAQATVFIAAAAVADYRPAQVAEGKIKKSDDALVIRLEPTADILGWVGRNKRNGLLVIGFAAETDDVLNYARGKLERKNLDAIVANDVTQPGAGFDVNTNIVTIISRRVVEPIALPLMSKAAAAHKILDEARALRAS